MIRRILICVCSIHILTATCIASNKDIWRNAEMLYRHGSYSAAYEKAMTLANDGYNYTAVCELIGNCANKQGAYVDARRYYNEALLHLFFAHDRVRIINAIADTYMSENDWTNAIQLLHKSVETDENGVAYYRLGCAYEQLGLMDQAHEMYAKAEMLAPNNIYVWHALAHFYDEKLQYEQAETYYQRIVQNNPDDAFARYRLAYIFMHTGKKETAYRMMSDCVKQFHNPMYLSFLADCAYSLGFYADAVSLYRRALLGAPDEMQWYCGLAFAYHALGNQRETERVLTLLRAQTGDSDPSMYQSVCMVLAPSQIGKDTLSTSPASPEITPSFFAQFLGTTK